MADSDAKEFDLACSNYIDIKVVASGAVASGEFVPDNTYAKPHHFAVAKAEAADDEYTGIIKADRVKVAVTVGIVATAGQKAYFDASENEVTDVSADGDYFIGYFADAVVATDTHGYIVFDGTIESNAASVGAIIESGIALGDLSDVDLTGAASGDQLTYDGTDWKPVNVVTDTGIGVGDLDDVDLTGLDDTEVLIYSLGDTTWKPGANS